MLMRDGYVSYFWECYECEHHYGESLDRVPMMISSLFESNQDDQNRSHQTRNKRTARSFMSCASIILLIDMFAVLL